MNYLPAFTTQATSPLEIIDRMITLLKAPDCWCKNEFAVDQNRKPVDQFGDRVYCVCIVGALGRSGLITGGTADKAYRGAVAAIDRVLAKLRPGLSISQFNDALGTTFGDVKDFLQRVRAELVVTPC